MTFQGDPYRTLGIAPGASLNEIRSAYRRLVKQYHPDAAGERALPRFLAIQAAYERLVDGEGRLRATGPASGRRTTGGAAGRGAGEPWRADPMRARASRDAWRARRGFGATAARGEEPGREARGDEGSTGATAGAASGPRPGSRPGSRSGSTTGSSTGSSTGARPGERPGRRGPRKATPGSTTYDEAAEAPRDPRWDGGAWYGPTSGTYWTLNPREYADPRKHGPEYLARARRAAQAGEHAADGGAGDPAAAGAEDVRPETPEPTPETDVDGEGGRWRWSGAGRTTTDGGSAEWGARAWTYRSPDPADGRTNDPGERRRGGGTAGFESASDAPWGDPGDAWARGSGAGRDPRSSAWSGSLPDVDDAAPLPDLESIARRAAPRSLLAFARRPDPRWRLLLAVVGWPPIGFAVGSLLSTVSGCATFSAACPDPLPLVPIAAQPLVIAALFLVPAAAAAAAFASIMALAVALPVAAVLSVGTVPESRVGAPVLGVLTAIAYLVALAAGTIAVWRPVPGEDDPAP